MFCVLDNNKPACYPYHKVDPSWSNNEFYSLSEAQAYANKWLGNYQVGEIPVNQPIDYSGYGDTIEIRLVGS